MEGQGEAVAAERQLDRRWFVNLLLRANLLASILALITVPRELKYQQDRVEEQAELLDVACYDSTQNGTSYNVVCQTLSELRQNADCDANTLSQIESACSGTEPTIWMLALFSLSLSATAIWVGVSIYQHKCRRNLPIHQLADGEAPAIELVVEHDPAAAEIEPAHYTERKETKEAITARLGGM